MDSIVKRARLKRNGRPVESIGDRKLIKRQLEKIVGGLGLEVDYGSYIDDSIDKVRQFLYHDPLRKSNR